MLIFSSLRSVPWRNRFLCNILATCKHGFEFTASLCTSSISRRTNFLQYSGIRANPVSSPLTDSQYTCQRSMSIFSSQGKARSLSRYDVQRPPGANLFRPREPLCSRYLQTSSSYEVNGCSIKEVDHTNCEEFLAKYDTLLLDCDGVVWGMDHTTPIPRIPETMAYLRSLGKQILFVTNNSMYDRDSYLAKFQRYGFDGDSKDIFCVAYAASVYLQQMMHLKGSVYLVGSDGMEHELNVAGIPNFGQGPDPDRPSRERDDLLNMHFRDDVSAVLVGYDIHFNLNKLYKAASYLTDPACLFVATNRLESGIMIAPNRFQPTTGVLVQAVMAASRREPEVVGKPDRHLYQCLVETHPSIVKSRTLMVGDSVRADMGFAKTVGLDSALVLSGASSLKTVEKNPGLEPEYFLQSLACLLPKSFASTTRG